MQLMETFDSKGDRVAQISDAKMDTSADFSLYSR